MSPPKVISAEFLLWSQTFLAWSIAAYGVTADPLREKGRRVRWGRWMLVLFFRSIFATILAYALSHSIVLSACLFFAVLLQPLLRYRVALQIAEFESLWIGASMVVSLVVIDHFHLATQWLPRSIASSQLAALCVIASTLLLVVRGGTYIVRGILTKSDTLP